MKFNFKTNPVTNLPQAQFQAVLKSISEKTLQNSNQKNYKVVGVEFENASGSKQLASAAIYEGNYSKGIEVGKSYLTTVTISEGKAYLQMSHLESAALATAEDFAFDAAEVGITATQATAALAGETK